MMMMTMTMTMTQTQTPDYTNTLNAPIEPGGFRRPCPSPLILGLQGIAADAYGWHPQ